MIISTAAQYYVQRRLAIYQSLRDVFPNEIIRKIAISAFPKTTSITIFISRVKMQYIIFEPIIPLEPKKLIVAPPKFKNKYPPSKKIFYRK